jgi:prepilin-type N-terminal cleavage/methylation domain-containing protein
MSALRRRVKAAGDGGITLVEMLVAITLLSVVMGLTSSSLIGAIRHQSNITQQTEAQSRNAVGMERVTRLLRQAVFPKNGTNKNSSIITVATPTSVQFTSRLTGSGTVNQNAFDTPIRQFSVQLVGSDLRSGEGAESATCGTPCAYATPTLTKTLVYGVRNAGLTAVCPKNTGDGAVFHYFKIDLTGNLAPWVSGTDALKDIFGVQIDLWTQTQQGQSRPACVPLTDYVQLRNWQ